MSSRLALSAVFVIAFVGGILMGMLGLHAARESARREGYAAAVDSVRAVVRFVPYQSPGAEVARVLDAYGAPYQFLVRGCIITVGWMDSARATYDTTAALPLVSR